MRSPWPSSLARVETIFGLVGLIVGFVLKALFDVYLDSRRNRREDKVRFHADKLRTYGEFILQCDEYYQLRREAIGLDAVLRSVDDRRDALIAEAGSLEMIDSGQGKELAAAYTRAADRFDDNARRLHQVADEIARISAVFSLLAPADLYQAAMKLASATIAWRAPADDAAHHTAYDTFIRLATRDLGLHHAPARMSGH